MHGYVFHEYSINVQWILWDIHEFCDSIALYDEVPCFVLESIGKVCMFHGLCIIIS